MFYIVIDRYRIKKIYNQLIILIKVLFYNTELIVIIH